MWSVLCNQAPITIEGGQSSSLDVGRNDVVPGDTTFSAVLFQTFYHPGSMIERYGGEAADTGLGSSKNEHLSACFTWAEVTD